MLIYQDLTLTENFSGRCWERHYFPAFTRVAEIAKEIGYPEGRVSTAIRKRKPAIAQWDIQWN